MGLLLPSADAMGVPTKGQFPEESRGSLGCSGGCGGEAVLLQLLVGARCRAAWFLD